jgi:hypothetical protein
LRDIKFSSVLQPHLFVLQVVLTVATQTHSKAQFYNYTIKRSLSINSKFDVEGDNKIIRATVNKIQKKK